MSQRANARAARTAGTAARSAGPGGSRPAQRSAGQMLLGLQETVGNQALHELLEAGLIHPKLRSGAPPDEPAEREAVRDELGSGRPLAGAARSRMESAFGRSFSGVRIHTDAGATRLSDRLNARAFTLGGHIAFGRGEYRPGTMAGDALLAHELAHVAQQRAGANAVRGAGGTAALERDADRSAFGAVAAVWTGALANAGPRLRSGLSLQRCPRSGGAPAPVREATPAERIESAGDAVRYLEGMARSIETRLELVRVSLLTPSAPGATGRERERLLSMVNQEAIGRLLQQARSVYEAQTGILPESHPTRLSLRDAYLMVLQRLREAADLALEVAEGMGADVQTRERGGYARNMAAWIEASPITSAGLAGTRTFRQGDVDSARRYEAELGRYLDDLLQRLPRLQLTQAQKDEIHNRILVALRRAFVTVAAGPSGRIDVRAITNQAIADKYMRVTAYLVEGTSAAARPQMDVITAAFPNYTLPDPVFAPDPPVPSGSPVRNIDVSRVPADEVLSVRYAAFHASAPFRAPSTAQLRNAYWPVTIPVRRGQGQPVERVRYEFIFDRESNLRAERLGGGQPRETTQEFSRLSVQEKKDRLVQEFGLSGVDDRPAAPAQPATPATPAGPGQPATPAQPAVTARPALPARTAAVWTGPELDQLKASLDLLPPADRNAIRGYALVREHQPPPEGAMEASLPEGSRLAGLTHASPDAIFDEPVPPAHPAPHIHFYDLAFTGGEHSATGPPGAAGPGTEFTVEHEVGHAVINRAILAANAALDAANRQRDQAIAPLRSVTLRTGAPINAFRAWNQAQLAANEAIVAYINSLPATPPVSDAQRALLLQTARTAVLQRNQVRARMAAAGVPRRIVQSAAALDAANDALLQAGLQAAAARGQTAVFNSLAQRLGFHRFTDYARRGGPDEWFTETYALYVTDPQRLLQMNRGVYLWFRAGMPMDPNWNPPVEGLGGG